MNLITTLVGGSALCVVSAVLGRLVLTRDQAWRTITVRLPALALLIASIFVCGLGSLIFAAVCFAGGSFYGLATWWLPSLDPLLEGIQYPLNEIISGRLEE